MTLFWKIRMFFYEIKERICNYFLVKKYPWLHPIILDPNSKEYREIRDPKYDYSYVPIWTEYTGWWKAFGREFCDEIQAEFPNCPDLYISEYKEKWGRLDIYPGNANENVLKICEKYSKRAEHTCWFCGNFDANIVDIGWELPLCKKCYDKYKETHRC